MEDDNDFTFCQVGSPVDQDGVETKNLASDMGAITIKDGKSNGEAGVSSKEKTVGSLSFTVIDASSRQQSSESPSQVAFREAGSSAKDVSEKKVSARKPAARTKVPFEKGYSPMDWMKLTQTHPDLAGLKGQSNKRLISMDEVKQHRTEGSSWTVLKGRVYNLSPYIKFHPGGADILKKAMGRDCTSLFNKYHAWVNAEFLLEKCLVGTLDVEQ